jgi:hypothetical protein
MTETPFRHQNLAKNGEGVKYIVPKAKLEQLAWLRKNEGDLQIKKEADKQYRVLWSEIEENWIAQGKPK